jgi:transmembrane sensor
VTLDRGEAYFQIKHDTSHPFVVFAGDHRVTDLGTKFIVRRDRSALKISLLEGSARVDGIGPRSDTASATLTPGDVAIATAETLVITKRPQRLLKDDLAWRRGLLVFSNTPLGDVVTELNRYNATKLTVADSETAKIGIGGTFPAHDTRAFVRVAHQLLGLSVASRGNELIISR